MSKRRSISNEIRLSQSFARLSLRQRDLWHGLIATADDQGRLPGLPAAVRSLVWPYDDVLLSDVQSDLLVLADIGNIIVYLFSDDQYIQIINWWEYQRMQWAGSSKYPAPDGWKDRERYHTKGREIITTNWDTPGGFFISTQDDNVKVNDKDNVNVNVNARPQSKPTKVANKGSQFPFDTEQDPSKAEKLQAKLSGAFTTATGLYEPSPGSSRSVAWVRGLVELAKMEATPDEVTEAVERMDAEGYTYKSPESIITFLANGRKDKKVNTKSSSGVPVAKV